MGSFIPDVLLAGPSPDGGALRYRGVGLLLRYGRGPGCRIDHRVGRFPGGHRVLRADHVSVMRNLHCPLSFPVITGGGFQ